MKKFIIFLTFFAFPLLAQNIVQLTNEPKETIITFKLGHPAHTTVGESKQLQIKIEYDKDKNKITKAIAQVKVISFNSGNSNRDSHAMELIEADKYPLATFRSTKILNNNDSLTIYGDLTFHNVTRNITINATKSLLDNKLKIKGNFAASLDQHNIERPKLLFVPTEEWLKFEFTAVFTVK